MSLRKHFDSANLAFAEYDPETKALEITFKNGWKYRYKDVPHEVFNDLCSAESAGRFHAAEIKNTYAYEKVSS
jgi:hypothetical protein